MIETELPDCEPVLSLVNAYSRGAEIGVARGRSSLAFLEKGCRMLLVDPWLPPDEGYVETLGSEEALKECLERLAPYTWKTHLCTILRMDSLAAARALMVPQEFDFVFIDANHRFDWVLADCKAWWPHIRSGGWLLGHDYNLAAFERGVFRAVHQFSSEIKIDVQEFPAQAGKLSCWGIRKP